MSETRRPITLSSRRSTLKSRRSFLATLHRLCKVACLKPGREAAQIKLGEARFIASHPPVPLELVLVHFTLRLRI